MINPVLAERIKYLKETKIGRKELSEVEMQFASKAFAEETAESKAVGFLVGKLEVTVNLLVLGRMPLETISQATGFSIEFLEELQSNLPPPSLA